MFRWYIVFAVFVSVILFGCGDPPSKSSLEESEYESAPKFEYELSISDDNQIDIKIDEGISASEIEVKFILVDLLQKDTILESGWESVRFMESTFNEVPVSIGNYGYILLTKARYIGYDLVSEMVVDTLKRKSESDYLFFYPPIVRRGQLLTEAKLCLSSLQPFTSLRFVIYSADSRDPSHTNQWSKNNSAQYSADWQEGDEISVYEQDSLVQMTILPNDGIEKDSIGCFMHWKSPLPVTVQSITLSNASIMDEDLNLINLNTAGLLVLD